jgi:hypothetical protein
MNGQKAPLGDRLRVAAALRAMPAAIIARRRASSSRSHAANQGVGPSCSSVSRGALLAAVGSIRRVTSLPGTTAYCMPLLSQGTRDVAMLSGNCEAVL